MARDRRKRGTRKNAVAKNDSYELRTRRSSMKVNLSFVSNLSDSGDGTSKTTNVENEETVPEEHVNREEMSFKTVKQNNNIRLPSDDTATPASVACITVIAMNNDRASTSEETESNSLTDISEKDQQLNKNCSKLKNEIITKTKALFEEDNELTRRMSQVFAQYTSAHENDDLEDKRSPSIRVDLEKHVQIIMSGDGKKKNPVQINSMQDQSPLSQKNNRDNVDCGESIASTPKKVRATKKATSRSPENMLRIPVARLFSDNNDPNDSMSQINPMNSSVTSHRTNVDQTKNTTALTSDLNQTTSPILSQGMRKSRISRLSLKRKLSKDNTMNTAESFVNRAPLTCSSFIEKPDKTIGNNNESNKIDDTVNLDDKSKSSNCKTIDLDDENNSKTINIDNSSSRSSMDLTTVSDHMPIIRRSFQHIIRKSLNLDNIVVPQEASQKPTPPSQKPTSVTSKSKSSITLDSTVEKSKSTNEVPEDCSINTIRTSLNVNTSQDELNSADSMQKENKEPNNSEEDAAESFKVDDTVVIPHPITTVSSKFYTPKKKSLKLNPRCIPKTQNDIDETESNLSSPKRIRTSLQVNTSLDTVTKPSASNQLEQEQGKSLDDQPSKNSTGSDKIVKVESRTSTTSTTSTVRSSMQVNTSLDSARKSPITKSKLDYQQILSMVEETSQNDDQNEDSDHSQNNKSQSSDSELDNASLMERMRNISASKKIQKKKVESTGEFEEKSNVQNDITNNNKTDETEDVSLNVTESSSESKTKKSPSKNSSSKRKSTEDAPVNKRKSLDEPNISPKKKLIETDQISDTSAVESNSDSDTNTTRSGIKRKSSDMGKRISKKKKSVNSTDRNISDVRRSTRRKNFSSTSNESSIVEPTPYPASRSMLFKTMIKNSIAMNTLDAKRLAMSSSSEDSEDSDSGIALQKKKVFSKKPRKAEKKKTQKQTLSASLSDTVILDSTNEVPASDSGKERVPVFIDESLNDTKVDNKKNNRKSKANKSDKEDDDNDDDHQKIKKGTTKRKLYPLRDNSQLVSFSPADIAESPKRRVPKISNTIKKAKKRNLTQKKKKQEKAPTPVEPPDDPVEEDEIVDNDEAPVETQKLKKKPRKIIRKKIVVKNATNTRLMDTLLDKEEEEGKSQGSSGRGSLGEFDLKRKNSNKKDRKSHRIVIVLTGLSQEDKHLVKSVIKKLGSAVLEQNVTPRTTHVISSGCRTINLLKAIIRGCWLLSLEWALKSLESEKWLDPAPYEMTYFAKAVQENRRDRRLFGKAYVPELFVTCGRVYIQNKTSPPPDVLKELVKIAGGRIIEDFSKADIIIGPGGLREVWILDSITTGELQPVDQYKQLET